jgi:hypothetical protein
MFHAMTLVMQVKLHIHEEGNKWPRIKFFPLLRNKRIDDVKYTNAPHNITLRTRNIFNCMVFPAYLFLLNEAFQQPIAVGALI